MPLGKSPADLGSNEEFTTIRQQIEEFSAQLNSETFSLVFNDTLVNDLQSRTLNMHKFVERFKGWLIIIRPDGNVRTNICTWGRSWRFDETLGNINNASLYEILEGYGPKVTDWLLHRFTTDEEVTRKFHLGSNIQLMDQDLLEVQSADANSALPIYEKELESLDAILLDNLPLGENLALLQQGLLANPQRYRIRNEDGFGLLFDTVTSRVSILTQVELETLRGV